MDKPITTTKQPTSILALPAELWSKIGRLVIDNSKHLSTRDFKHRNSEYHQPPITRTCRILREELLPYFYATKIHIAMGADYDLGSWLRALDRETRCFIDGITTTYHASKKGKQRALLADWWRVDLMLKEVRRVGDDSALYAIRFV